MPAQQSPHIFFRHLDITNGLSQNSINGIVQDKRGFIWFGTQDGLNRYNGYSFTIYKQGPSLSNSLSHSYILALRQDVRGNLLIGTERGLNCLDLDTELIRLYASEPGNANSLLSNRIADVYESPLRPGFIWVATNAGLDCLETASGRISHFQNDPKNPNSLSSNAVTVIYEAKSLPGILWVGSEDGLNRIDQKSGAIKRYTHDPAKPGSLSNNSVQAIYEAPSLPGMLWIGTLNGLCRLNMKDDTFLVYVNEQKNAYTMSHNRVRAIFEYAQEPGILWVGTYGGGLNRLDMRTGRFSRFVFEAKNPGGISDNFILKFLEDRSGNVWIGTEGGGINLYSRAFKNFSLFRNIPDDPNSLVSNNVRGFCESLVNPSILWIGTYGGLSRFDRSNQQFTSFRHDPADPGSLSTDLVRCVYEDRNGDLWIGTYDGGLNLLKKGSRRFLHFVNNPKDASSISANNIRVILEDHKDSLWLGTVGGGLNRFDRATLKFTSFRFDAKDPSTLCDDRIYSICEDPAGYLWVGSGNGLNRFDPATGKSLRYQFNPYDPGSLSGDMVFSVHIDPTGTLWVGTWGGGLNQFDRKTSRFTHFSEEQGLANNVVYGIQGDGQGNLWLSTNHGISRFDTRTKRFKNYDEHDGLQSNEFNHGACYRSPKGKLYFGGIKGFNSFYPEQIKDNTQIPHVVITDLLLFNKSVRVGEKVRNRVVLKKPIYDTTEINLSYQQNILSFEFTALNFINPEKNEYAYMLEGLEESWNYVGNRRFAAYTTLPPGRYLFRVKASNNDGIWNDKGAEVAIRIFPPFWKTWWFLTLCGLMVVLAGGSLVYSRLTRLERRRRELEKLVAERTQALFESNTQLSCVNEELKKLSIVASETDNAVVIMDAAGDLEWVNEGFVRRYRTLEEVIAAKGRNILKASSNPRIAEFYEKCTKAKETVIYETELKGKNGERAWMQTTLTPILDKSGNITKIVAIDADITRIKEAEAEIFHQKEMISSQKNLLEQAIQELERLATHDSLTGIANHRRFYEFFETEWKRAIRNRKPVSLIMADVDFFKDYNDTFGHLYGDQCLKRIAQLMSDNLHRPTDLVARYGGEEFIVVLSETDSSGAAMLAEKIRKAVEEQSCIPEHAIKGRLTISIGCATTSPKQGTDSEILIKAADKALYKSKQTGRNRVTTVKL